MADGSNETFDAVANSTKSASPLFTVGGILLGIVAVLLVIALFLPAKRAAPEAARRNQCLNNLRQIGIAIRNYESDFGSLPPAYTVDAEGNRLHSWRTLILPYIEEKALYERIELTKPWDDPANAEAREQLIEVYSCPSADFEDFHLTTYLAVVGPDFAFSDSVPREMAEVTDGAGKTILVVDVSSDRAIHWMSPHDLSEEDLLAVISNSETHHPGIFQALFLDGHGKGISLDIDPKDFRALLTIAGGEEISESL